MATTKAYRTKASGTRAKRNQTTGVTTAVLGNSCFHEAATPVPYNPRVRHLMPNVPTFQPAKVIVFTVDSKLDQISAQPLSQKAASAKQMFAKYRKSL